MPLINCKICGQVFETNGIKNICRKCIEIEEEEFQKVRTYVKDNPRVPMNIVSEETGVPVEKIHEFLRRGLLERASIEEANLKCQLCGASILAGNYCMTCMDKLKSGLKTSGKKEKKDNSASKSFMLEYKKKRG